MPGAGARGPGRISEAESNRMQDAAQGAGWNAES